MNAEFLLMIADLVIKHGVPATIRLIKAFEIEDPTLEDILALKDQVPPPESYFTPDKTGPA